MKSVDIKQKILDAAKALLRQNGYLTIKDIADYCYINIAAVNYHFGSKEKLIYIVVDEILNELKTNIIDQINVTMPQMSKKDFLESIITYVYNFALENAGILSYLFLSREQQSQTTNQLIDMFLSDNDFTKLVYEKFKENSNITNSKELTAKYVMIFSSLAIPLLMQLVQKDIKTNRIETFLDPEFKTFYVNQLLTLVG